MKRERHGFVTFWLFFILVCNAIYGGIYFYRAFTEGNITFFYLGILSLAAVAAAVLLLCWKKIGFWLFLGVQIVCIPINISLGVNKIQSIAGIVSVIILLGILKISKNGRSTWDYLSNKNLDENPSSAAQSQLNESKPLFTPVSGDTWVCKKCSEVNSSTSSSCRGCGEYR